jgi:hypothetical protein
MCHRINQQAFQLNDCSLSSNSPCTDAELHSLCRNNHRTGKITAFERSTSVALAPYRNVTSVLLGLRKRKNLTLANSTPLALARL